MYLQNNDAVYGTINYFEETKTGKSDYKLLDEMEYI